jgi:ring-1,2-phenylacetyl-CoA epoxidase subunit PaaC
VEETGVPVEETGVPAATGPLAGSGRDGAHTAALTDILAELQSVARSMPGGVW